MNDLRKHWFLTLPGLMLGSAFAGLAAPAAPTFAQDSGNIGSAAACEALDSDELGAAIGEEVTFDSLRYVPVAADFPAFCEVEARIDQTIRTTVRLPDAGETGRFLMQGCGGLCGSIEMRATDDALARGYTVALTDMGHEGPNIAFAHDAKAIDDFAWRATHLSTRLGKAAFASLNGTQPDHSYFRGCSTGGRQAITEALLFPDDFDGIIAGAPAHQMAAATGVWAMRSNLRSDGTPILDEAAITLLHEKALASCDADDGYNDGIIGNPLQCSYRPSDLACTAEDDDGQCLTPEQIGAANAIYDGIETDAMREYTSMGYAIGSEPGWIDAFAGRDGRPPWALAVAGNYMHRFKDLPEPPSQIADLDFDRYPVRITRVEAIPSFGSEPMLLNRFAKAGGKMLVYAGWADPALTPATTLDFVAEQQRAMGGDGALDTFLRLYMIPGYGHCGGGPGAGEVDFLSAMENWIERGERPETLTAYKVRTGPSPTGPTRFPVEDDQVAFERKLPAFELSNLP